MRERPHGLPRGDGDAHDHAQCSDELRLGRHPMHEAVLVHIERVAVAGSHFGQASAAWRERLRFSRVAANKP